MTDHQKPHPPSGGPRHYGEPPLDSTSLLDDPGLTQTLDRPVALDATTPIWVRFGPGVPAATAVSAVSATSATAQDPGMLASPGNSANRRGARRVRRPAVSFVSLLTVAAGVAWLARLLHRLP